MPLVPWAVQLFFRFISGLLSPDFFLFRRVGGVWWGGFWAKFEANRLGRLMGRAGTAIEMGVLLGCSDDDFGCGWTLAATYAANIVIGSMPLHNFRSVNCARYAAIITC